MGLLPLDRLMSMQHRRRPTNLQSPYGSVDLMGKRKGSPCQQDCVPGGSTAADQANRKGSSCQQDCVPGGSTAADQVNRKGSPCQQDDSSQSGKTDGCSGPNLPEDIWSHIHSLMPLRDAARAACVSRAFLCFWRCHPNLTFSWETLGLDKYVFGKEQRAYFTRKTDHILENHSGTGIRTLKLSWAPDYSSKDRYYLDRWLQMAATPGIEELSLVLDSKNGKYNFPCSVLSNGTGDSIRCLSLAHCSFRPTGDLCCLRSLTRVNLSAVRITGDELWCLLSNSFALELLSLRACSEIFCLKIPCGLQRLSYLSVFECRKLQLVESNAPNLSMFDFDGKRQIQVSLGESLLVKSLFIKCSGSGYYYTRAELVSSMPTSMPTNLETLGTYSSRETIDAPMVSSKFLQLNSLVIGLTGVPFVLSVNNYAIKMAVCID